MEYKKPDWSYWLIQDAWTLREALWLSLDHDPNHRRGGTNIPSEALTDDFKLRETVALRSAQAGSLPTIKGTPLNASITTIKRRVSDPHRGIVTRRIPVNASQPPNIRPMDFIPWALNKKFKIPQELINFTQDKNTPTANTEGTEALPPLSEHTSQLQYKKLTLREAVWLVLGKDPGLTLPENEEQSEEFLRLEQLAIAHNEGGALQTIDGSHLQKSRIFIQPGKPSSRSANPHYQLPTAGHHLVPQEKNLEPKTFFQWADKQGYSIPQLLTPLLEEDSDDISPEGMKAIANFNPGKRQDKILLAEQITTYYLRDHIGLSGEKLFKMLRPSEDYSEKRNSKKSMQNRRANTGKELLNLIFAESKKSN